MKRTRRMAGLAAGLAMALVASACSSDDNGNGNGHENGQHGSTELAPVSTGDPFVDLRTAAQHMPESAAVIAGGFAAALDIPGETDSPAADLRAGLTALLQEHVYVAGVAVATAYTAGPDSAEFGLAAQVVDANSVALADAVGSLAGEEERDVFLARWRDHIEYFVDYALAAAADDDAARGEAVAELREYASDAGAFFERVSGGELPAAAVEEELNGHIDTLAEAVEAFAAEDADAFEKLRHAAHHVVDGAAVLAGGLSTAAGLEGDPNDDASSLRAALTANLNEHVYLAGIAVFVAYTQGAESDAFGAAAAEVDANAVELADAVGSLAGDDNRELFLNLWRDHITYFVNYAVAAAEGDTEGTQAQLDNLDDYRNSAGAFFEELSGGELPADAIADALGHHINTLAGAIDSLVGALL